MRTLPLPDTPSTELIQRIADVLSRTPRSVLAHNQKRSDGRTILRALADDLGALRSSDPEWCDKVASALQHDASTQRTISMIAAVQSKKIDMVNMTFPAVGFALIIAAGSIEGASFGLVEPTWATLVGFAILFFGLAAAGMLTLVYGGRGERWRRELHVDLLALHAAMGAPQRSTSPRPRKFGLRAHRRPRAKSGEG